MNWPKVTAVLAAFSLSAGLWLSLQPETNPASTANHKTHASFQWAYTNGQVVGPTDVDVMQGQTVSITITSDTNEQLRLHGYEEWLALPAQRTSTFELIAKHQGRFELELDQAQRTLAHMQVYPAPKERVTTLASNLNFTKWR